jgi:hypothetical protein
MTSVSTERGEYAMWKLEDVFPKEVITNLASTYALNPEKLSDALAEVVADYDSDAPFFFRLPIWHEAKDKAQATLGHLEKAKQLWLRSQPRIKQTVAEMTFNEYSSEQLECDLERIISALKELTEITPKSRGNQGQSRKDKSLHLTAFKKPASHLNKLWVSEKGKPLGHEMESHHYRERGFKVETYNKLKSKGIEFLHACLQRLDDRITPEACRTLIKSVKAKHS